MSCGGTDFLRILFDSVGCGFSGSRFFDGGRDYEVGFFVGGGGGFCSG